MKVSVIVPVKNQPAFLHRCLKSLHRQDYRDLEIIVVDNASDDDAVRQVCEQFPSVRYGWEAQPGSYAARNHGLALATGDIIAFTDADCLPYPSWVSNGVFVLETMAIDIVVGHINFLFSATPPPLAEYLDSLCHLNQARYAAEGYGATANLIVRRSAFAQVGNFRDDLLHLGDREWGKRATRAGLRLQYSVFVIVEHPARSGPALIKKLRAGTVWRHRLEPFTWGEVMQLVMLQPANMCAAWRDPNLPTIGVKVRFMVAAQGLRWLVAVQIVRLLSIYPDNLNLRKILSRAMFSRVARRKHKPLKN